MIWSGFGILVPVTGLLSAFATDAFFDNRGNGLRSFAVAGLISAIVLFVLSYGLKRRRALLADEITSGRMPEPDDSFLVFPVRFWPWISLVFAGFCEYFEKVVDAVGFMANAIK